MPVMVIEMTTRHSEHFPSSFHPFSTPSVISCIFCLYHSFLKSYYYDIKSTLHATPDALMFTDFTLDSIDRPLKRHNNFVREFNQLRVRSISSLLL